MDRPARPTFETAGATHPGKLRAENEDAYVALAEAGLWAVADGMGGHHAGQFASRTMIDALSRIEPQDSAARLLARCEESVIEANGLLFDLARAQGATIGTTLAALLAYDNNYACLWSGDSRIYRVRDGAIALLSRDHTEVQDLVESGILTAEEGRTSPKRNIITRAIGVGVQAEVEIAHGVLRDGDVFLLCTDGLTNHVADAELRASASGRSCEDACRTLIDLALARGGTDNVTVLMVRCREDGGGALPAAACESTVVEALTA